MRTVLLFIIAWVTVFGLGRINMSLERIIELLQ